MDATCVFLNESESNANEWMHSALGLPLDACMHESEMRAERRVNRYVYHVVGYLLRS